MRTARHYRDGVNSQQRFNMNEQNIGDVNQHQIAAPVNTTSAPPAPAPVAPQPAPKTFTQDEVNEIVGRTRKEARESYTGHTANTAQPTQAQPTQAPSNAPAYQSPEDLRKLVREEALQLVQQQNQQAHLASFANNLNMKMQAEREKDAGFSDVERAMNLPGLSQTNPHFVLAIGSLDNTGAIMRDLHQNPAKFATVLQLMSNPATQNMGISQLQALSDSIKQNQAAVEQAKNTTPHDPLSQIRTSVNTPDNGPMTPSDYRKRASHRA